MRTFIWSLVVTAALLGPISAAEIPTKTSEAAAKAPSTEDALKALRNDLQAKRADIMAKNLTLTAEQASKFWAAYAKFQDEQNVIVDEQLKALKAYVDGYNTLDDAAALKQVNANLDRDLKMNNLRRKWLVQFQMILPTRTAARVIQIDRRLGLAGQMLISAQIPLIY